MLNNIRQSFFREKLRLNFPLFFLVYFFLAVILYWNGLKSLWINGCTFDHMLAFPFAIKVKDLVYFFTRFYHDVVWEKEYHPFVTLIYFFNARLGGDNPGSLRLLNLFFISFNSTLVYASTLYIIRRHLWAFIAGIIYISHTFSVEPIYIPDCDADLIMACFVLIAFLAHCYRRPFLVVSAYLIALFSKETAIVFPVSLLLYDLLMTKDFSGLNKNNLKREYFLLFLMTAGYLFLNFFVINATHISFAVPPNPIMVASKAGYNLLAAFQYLISFPVFIGPFCFFIFFMSAILFVCIFKIESYHSGWRWPFFCFSWIILGLLPVLGVIPVKQLTDYLYAHQVEGIWICKRYLFFPAIAFCWLLGSFFNHTSQNKSMKIRFFSYLVLLVFICSNILATGCSLFSTKSSADTHAEILLTREHGGIGRFNRMSFFELALPSLAFLGETDRLVIKDGLLHDFTPYQVNAIMGYFVDPGLHRDPLKVQSFFVMRRTKSPQEFIDALNVRI